MLSRIWMKDWTRRAMGMMMLALLAFFAAEASASTPAAVLYSHTTVSSTGLASNQAGIALDACGNLYTIQSGTGNVYETPAGGGTATLLYTGVAYSWSGDISIYINPAKTYAFISEGFGGSNQVVRIPITNCSLQTSQSANVTNNFSNGWTASGAVTTDAAGDIFYSNYHDEGIIETTADLKTQTELLTGLSALPSGLAVDSKNNLYYAINGSIYELTYSGGAYSTTPVTISTGYVSVVGLTFDGVGNLYVTDAGTQYASDGSILVIPNETTGSTTALNPSDQYVVAGGPTNSWTPLLTLSLSSAVAVDGQGNVYYGNGDSNVNEFTVGRVNFGSLTIGNTATATLYAVFNAAATPAAININSDNGAFKTTGGTCAATTDYKAGDQCTITASFTPVIPGVAESALTLTDSTGNVLGAAYLSGVGGGAGLTVDPGTVTSVGSGYGAPKGAVVDAAGNLYIADKGSKSVYEIASGSSTLVALGSGLAAPQGVALDGAGNLLVADTGNNRIVKIPVVNGTLSTAAQTVVIDSATALAGSTLNAPEAVAVDASGNLYIADTGNKRVLYLPYNNGWNALLALTVGSGLTSPSAVAFDAAANLYVADSGTGDVYKLQLPVTNIVQSTVLSGYSNPSGLAFDASGSLFVVDQGNEKVWRVPNISGTLTATSALNVTGQLNAAGTQVVAAPYGVALDASGNVYVTDSTNAAVYAIARTSSTQSAGMWTPGTTSDPVAYFVENAGNSVLTFATPFETATGDTTQFNLLSSETGACTDGDQVAAGSSCNVEATFAPTTAGNYTETLALSSNAANVSSLTIAFTGKAVQTYSSTTTLTQTSPSGSPAFDQPVTFQAKVSSANGTPDGSVSLAVDGITEQTTPLSNGTVSFTLAGGVLSGGSHSITAKYLGGTSGDLTYSASTSPALTVNVTTVGTLTTVSYSTTYTGPATQLADSGLLLTAEVTSSFAGTPTGTVTFTITDSGHNSITETSTLVTGVATYLYTPTAPASNVPYDVVSVTATYSGDNSFIGSTSASSSFDVTGAQGAAVVTPSSLSLTTSSKTPGTVTFSVVGYGGFNGVVGFTCDSATLPAYSTCVFSPGQASIPQNTTSSNLPASTVTMSLVVNQPTPAPTAGKMIWWIAGPLGLLLLFARRRMKKLAIAGRWNMLLLMAVIGTVSACIMGATACSDNAALKTPKGTSTVTVYATADPYVYSNGTVSSSELCTTTVDGKPQYNYPCSHQAFNVNVTVQ